MRSRVRTIIFIGAAFILFISGFFMVRFPVEASHPVPGMIAIVLIALPAVIGAVRWLGTRRAILLLCSLAIFAYVIEYVGVTTGFPYSPFTYGGALGPKLFGVLPVLLPFAYVPLVLGVVALCWSLRQRVEFFIPSVAVTLTLVDLVLDPGAVALGHWSYDLGGVYYGAPFYNFLGWLLSGSFAALIVALFVQEKRAPPRLLVVSAALMLVFWTGIALWYSLWVPLAIGVLFCAFCVWQWSHQVDAV